MAHSFHIFIFLSFCFLPSSFFDYFVYSLACIEKRGHSISPPPPPPTITIFRCGRNTEQQLGFGVVVFGVCDGESTSYSTKMMMSYHVYNTKRHRRYYSRVGCVSCAVCGLNIMSCRLVVASSLQKVEKKKKLHRRRCVVCAQCTQCRCQFYVPSSYFIRFDDDDDTHTHAKLTKRTSKSE